METDFQLVIDKPAGGPLIGDITSWRTTLAMARTIVVGWLAMLGLALATETAAACNWPGVTGVSGQVVSISMSVQQGKTCMKRHFTSRSDAVGNRQFPTSDLRVTSGPSKGSIDISGNRITYRAKPGTSGSDTFQYRATTNNGRAYDYRVMVDIY